MFFNNSVARQLSVAAHNELRNVRHTHVHLTQQKILSIATSYLYTDTISYCPM